MKTALVLAGMIASGPAYAEGPEMEATSYPPTYRVLSKDKLDAMKSAVEARNPGWTVEIQPIGLLASAHFGVTPKPGAATTLTNEDRARAHRFFDENRELVGGDLRSATLKHDRPERIFYQQLVAGTVVSFVAIHKLSGQLNITGHLLPNFTLPVGVSLKSDDELRSLLGGDNPGEPQPLVHGTRLQADYPAQEIEIHLSACIKEKPAGKCVDAIDGRALTRGVSMSVTTDSRTGTSYVVKQGH